MKIVPIFTPYLHSFKFEGETDELSKLIDLWTNKEHLYYYFKIYDEVIKYEQINIAEAIKQTVKTSLLLYDLLSANREQLDKLFRSLSKSSYQTQLLPKYKSAKKWLRIYAIRIESNYYVVTGGAIKQSQKMQDHVHTGEELKKLELGRNFLIEKGVFDADSLIDFVEFDV